MRLRIFGIPKSVLMFLGFMPVLLWCALHPSSVSYREQSTGPVLIGGLVLALLFTYFFTRGFFKLRFAIVLLSSLVFLDAFISAMGDRDFLKLGLTLLCFAASFAIFMWFEKRVLSADVNPQVQWFEGSPKFLPQLEAQVKIGDSWKPGRVGVIDRNGFFVFMEPGVQNPSKGRVAFTLTFKTMEIQGESKLNAHFYGRPAGFGLQFLPKDLYHFSQYTALVERLKGEGL